MRPSFCALCGAPLPADNECAFCGATDYPDARTDPLDTILWVALFLSMIILVIIAAFGTARASELCVSLDSQKTAVEKHHGKWIPLSQDQWQFMRGIFAMNPLTPPGLPIGDKAAMVRIDGDEGALVFFIDGDQACTPMPVPAPMLEMLNDIAAGKIHHEGAL